METGSAGGRDGDAEVQYVEEDQARSLVRRVGSGVGSG